MTIAACYVSSEGVVLGADSTTTYNVAGNHYYNHTQKLLEIGEDSTLGIVTWGLGTLITTSYRKLIADFADDLAVTPANSVHDAADRWSALFWGEYTAGPLYLRWGVLSGMARHDPTMPAAGQRSAQEEEEFVTLSDGLIVGFCIGGAFPNSRTPGASVVIVDPNGTRPMPQDLPVGAFNFWGAPNIVSRLIFGYDPALQDAILTSPHWNGTPQELSALLQNHYMAHPPTLPIREAIDFINFCIFSTIKAFKFSNFSQVCGGPIEIAVVTVDRAFRWVRHKSLQSAIVEGDTE